MSKTQLTIILSWLTILVVAACAFSYCTRNDNSAAVKSNIKSQDYLENIMRRDDAKWLEHDSTPLITPTSKWGTSHTLGGEAYYYRYVNIDGLRALQNDSGAIYFLPNQK